MYHSAGHLFLPVYEDYLAKSVLDGLVCMKDFMPVGVVIVTNM